MKPSVHAREWGPQIEISLPFPLEIWVDQFPSSPSSNSRRILAVMEPEVILGLNAAVLDQADSFDYVLTHDPLLLELLPNAVLFEFGTSWIDNYAGTPEQKEFSVSLVCGSKAQTEGHRLRQWLWARQHEIDVPCRFFSSSRDPMISSESRPAGLRSVWPASLRRRNSRHSGPRNPELGDSKLPLFDSMFHIAIENSSGPHYFTEKIVDPMMCQSIPIYWGCTRIEEYFNPDGMFVVRDPGELIPAINRLTDSDYWRRADAIAENRDRADKWAKLDQRLEELLARLYLSDS